MAKKVKEVEETVFGPQEQIQAFLKENKEFHYNFEETRDYKVSSGSLKLDLETNGGLCPGVHRFSGISGGGKSSLALAYARNFQLLHGDNGMVIFIKAEGRLTQEMIVRSGVSTDPKQWFLFETNVFETALDLMRDMIGHNPTKKFYLFIVDSMDALIPKGDLIKGTDQAMKVAGGAVLTGDFLRRMTLAMAKRGHMVIMMSQRRAQIQLDKYKPIEQRITGSSGGMVLEHYPWWVFEFQPRFKKDITLDENERPIGHDCKIIFRKSVNERDGLLVKYPIRYGRSHGRSVWIEKEIIDILMAFDKLKGAGAWINFDPSFIELAKQDGVELPEKFNGTNKLLAFLEENTEITKYLFQKVYNIVLGANVILAQEPEEDESEAKEEF